MPMHVYLKLSVVSSYNTDRLQRVGGVVIMILIIIIIISFSYFVIKHGRLQRVQICLAVLSNPPTPLRCCARYLPPRLRWKCLVKDKRFEFRVKHTIRQDVYSSRNSAAPELNRLICKSQQFISCFMI